MLEVVLKVRLAIDDACLIYRLLKPLKASDLIELVGDEGSREAHDCLRKLRLELINELSPPFVKEFEHNQKIYLATRMRAEEVQALKRCIRHEGFLGIVQGNNTKPLSKKSERALYELLSALESAYNLYDDPYQDFDGSYRDPT